MFILTHIKVINSGECVVWLSRNQRQSKSWNSDFLPPACQGASIRSNFPHEGTCNSVVSLFWADIIICVQLCVVAFWSGLLCPLIHTQEAPSFPPSLVLLIVCSCFKCLSPFPNIGLWPWIKCKVFPLEKHAM